MRLRTIIFSLPLILLTTASGTVAPAADQTPSPSAPAGRCDTLAIDLPGLSIDTRQPRAAISAAGAKPALPAHCELVGHLDDRTGADGERYAIRFRLRLPDQWNHRFFFQGGGGSNGVTGDALGNLQGEQTDVALARGYAVVSQDSGHDNATNNRPDHGGTSSFGWDQKAREDYAYASLGRVTDAAKAIIHLYYGDGPRFSYFVGCSKGGQEGMAVAEHFPESFNGIMANAPGFALPRAAVAQAYDTQAFAAAARSDGHVSPAGLPLIGDSFTDVQLGLVSRAILNACDARDGLADGIVAKPVQCTSVRVRARLSASMCKAGKSGDCLTQAQTDALFAVMAGARGKSGRTLYSEWAWDPGIGGLHEGRTYDGWRAWKLGAAGLATPDARNVMLGGASLASTFTTPATAVSVDAQALLHYLLNLDLDAAAHATEATNANFSVSPWQLLSAQSTDRDAFRRAGGKMIVAHGAADPVFSLLDTIRWWTGLDKRYNGRASDFTRLFAVPGMNHCRGGPATSRFDAFTALVDWVEKSQAPDAIIATAPEATPWPGRQRPLCPYPSIARYKGKGSIEKVGNFVCRR